MDIKKLHNNILSATILVIVALNYLIRNPQFICIENGKNLFFIGNASTFFLLFIVLAFTRLSTHKYELLSLTLIGVGIAVDELYYSHWHAGINDLAFLGLSLGLVALLNIRKRELSTNGRAMGLFIATSIMMWLSYNLVHTTLPDNKEYIVKGFYVFYNMAWLLAAACLSFLLSKYARITAIYLLFLCAFSFGDDVFFHGSITLFELEIQAFIGIGFLVYSIYYALKKRR